MSEFSPQVDDLILFFRKEDGTVDRRWVPHEVYSDSALEVPLEPLVPGWKGTVFAERSSDGARPYYFANLSLLLDPGVPPPLAGQGTKLPQPIAKYKKAAPEPGDLVLVPHDKSDRGFLVSQKLYLDCPEMLDAEAFDPITMVSEGVVLANMPKVDLSGYTCYLLNLLSLRTGALAQGEHKTAHSARVSAALGRKDK
jgi:hypothetical protein